MRTLLSCLVIILLAAAPVLADTFVLKNGNRIKGTVEAEFADYYLVNLDSGGQMRIMKKNIAQRITEMGEENLPDVDGLDEINRIFEEIRRGLPGEGPEETPVETPETIEKEEPAQVQTSAPTKADADTSPPEPEYDEIEGAEFEFSFNFEETGPLLKKVLDFSTVFLLFQFAFFFIASKVAGFEKAGAFSSLILAFFCALVFFAVSFVGIQFMRSAFQGTAYVGLIIANIVAISFSMRTYRAPLAEITGFAVALVVETIAGMFILNFLLGSEKLL